MRNIRVTNPFSKTVEIEGVKVKPHKTEDVCRYIAEKKPLVSALKKRGYVVKVVDVNVEKTPEEVKQEPIVPPVEEFTNALGTTDGSNDVNDSTKTPEENPEKLVETKVDAPQPKVDNMEPKTPDAPKKSGDTKQKPKQDNNSSKKA